MDLDKDVVASRGDQDPGSSSPQVPFEPLLAQLQQVVDDLESGHLDLDQALARYGEGVHLVATCREWLQAGQHRVRTLTAVGEKLTTDEKLCDAKQDRHQVVDHQWIGDQMASEGPSEIELSGESARIDPPW